MAELSVSLAVWHFSKILCFSWRMGSRSLAGKCHFFFLLNVSLNLSWSLAAKWSFAEWLVIWFIPSNTSDQRLQMNASERKYSVSVWFDTAQMSLCLCFSLASSRWAQTGLLLCCWVQTEAISSDLRAKAVFLWCFEVLIRNTSSAHLRHLKALWAGGAKKPGGRVLCGPLQQWTSQLVSFGNNMVKGLVGSLGNFTP